jgi:hypothetical protein
MLKALINLIKSAIKRMWPTSIWLMKIIAHLIIAILAAILVEVLKEKGVLKALLPYVF